MGVKTMHKLWSLAGLGLFGGILFFWFLFFCFVQTWDFNFGSAT